MRVKKLPEIVTQCILIYVKQKMQHMEKEIQTLKAQIHALEGSPIDVCDVDNESHDTPGVQHESRGQHADYLGKFSHQNSGKTIIFNPGRIQRRGHFPH